MAEETKNEEINETAEATETKEKKPEFPNKVTVEDSGPCKKKVIIEVPEEAIKAATEDQYKELKTEAVVPGFRKGRAPLRLLEKRFGTDVSKQVKLKLLADASEKALEDLDTLGDPDIDHENIELPETGPMKFEFEVEVRPEFDLPELEGIKVEKPKLEVTDEQIDEEITQMCERAGVWVPKEDGACEDGDQVVADVTLEIEGVDEHDRRDNVEIFARERGFVAGVAVDDLNKLLKGAKHGDVKKTTVDVPETYFNEKFRGKKVEVEIEVKEVKQLEPAELNEEFFNRFGVEDEDDLRDSLREARTTQNERAARQQMNEQIYQYLLDKIDLDLPASIVADQSMRIMQRQYTQMLIQGVPKEQIDQQIQDLQASSQTQATEQMKLFFIMNKVAEKFDIEVSEEQINGYIAQAAAQKKTRPEKMRQEMERDGSLVQFIMQIREQKSIEKILESADIVEVEPEKAAKPKKKAAKKTAKKSDKKEAKPKAKKTAAKGDEKATSSRKETSAKRTKKKTKKTEK